MNVETSLIWQLACFSVCGIFLGAGYEVLRVLRTVIPHHSFIVGVEDTFYLALCGLVLFGLSMEIGNGIFRASYLFSAAVGAIVYFLTFGRLVKLVYTMVIKTTIKIVKIVFGKLLKPVWKVHFYKIMNNKIKRAEAALKKHRRILYNNDNKLERDEVVNVSRIEGKIRKIQ